MAQIGYHSQQKGKIAASKNAYLVSLSQIFGLQIFKEEIEKMDEEHKNKWDKREKGDREDGAVGRDHKKMAACVAHAVGVSEDFIVIFIKFGKKYEISTKEVQKLNRLGQQSNDALTGSNILQGEQSLVIARLKMISAVVGYELIDLCLWQASMF
ncbi:hypothetical protein ACJX0J_037730, partial [Zea mays]